MLSGLPYWGWLAIGLSLLFIEVIMTHFVMVFFGLGALIVCITTLIGLTTGTNSQLVLFSASSLAMLLLVRKTFLVKFAARQPGTPPDYAGSIAKAETDITQLGGYASYRGSQWIAYRVEGTEPITAGSYIDIVGIDGVKLKVKPHSHDQSSTQTTTKEEQ
jgi:membrane protein implicated in regulation of membrane protease activity